MFCSRNGMRMCVCVCVCVWEREAGRRRGVRVACVSLGRDLGRGLVGHLVTCSKRIIRGERVGSRSPPLDPGYDIH